MIELVATELTLLGLRAPIVAALLLAAIRSTALVAAAWLVLRLIGRHVAPADRRRLWTFVCWGLALLGALAVADVVWPGPGEHRWVAVSDSQWRSTAASMIWGLPTLILLVKLGLARRAAHRILASSRPISSPDWQTSIAAAARAVRLAAQPEVRTTTAVDVPAAVGAWRRVVVVPERFLDTPEPLRGAVLRHEMEHVRGLDVLARHISLLARALLWFSPAVWIAARNARVACECACDAAAAHDPGTRAEYGRYLAGLALPHQSLESAVVAPLGAADLILRLEALAEPAEVRPQPALSWLLGVLLVAAVLWIELPRPGTVYFVPGSSDSGSPVDAAVWTRQ